MALSPGGPRRTVGFCAKAAVKPSVSIEIAPTAINDVRPDIFAIPRLIEKAKLTLAGPIEKDSC
ncbi:MAG: hypothetical protein O3C34_16540, partial [Proteobacteria bacterium]|nr:hypothetical protein [Pseudomonadota bacterium]